MCGTARGGGGQGGGDNIDLQLRFFRRARARARAENTLVLSSSRVLGLTTRHIAMRNCV